MVVVGVVVGIVILAVLVMAAMSTVVCCAGEAAMTLAGEGARPAPARSVTIIAACTPRASASTHVATRGPRVKNRARHFSDPGTAWSQEAALIEVGRSWIRWQTPDRQRSPHSVRLTLPGNHTALAVALSSDCFAKRKRVPSSQACVADSRPL